MQTEQAVKMAAKLYECRDTAKQVFGDCYHKRMDAYCQVVKSAANAMRCSDIAAATTLANKAGGGMAAICYLAAVVEMTEPSNASLSGPNRRAQADENGTADPAGWVRSKR